MIPLLGGPASREVRALKKNFDERRQYTNKYTNSNAGPNPDWEE